jgi:hypothetical protein
MQAGVVVALAFPTIRQEVLGVLVVALMEMHLAKHLQPQSLTGVAAVVEVDLQAHQEDFLLAAPAALALSSYATQHLISLYLCSTLLPSGLLLSA